MSHILQLYESEEQRNAAVRAARAKRDALKIAYDKAVRLVNQLERGSRGGKTKDKSEVARQGARDEVYRLRTELRQAQRELIRL
jgi:hypothetical protein